MMNIVRLIFIVLAVLYYIAKKIAPKDNNTDKQKKNIVLEVLFILLVVLWVTDLILSIMSLQIMPNVEHIIVMILLPLAFIVLLFDITRHIGIRIITVLLTVALLYLGAVSIPVYHGVKEFNGEEYVGISDDSFSDWKFIYYYKTKFPLVISKDYEILEDYGIVLTSDWNVIKENGPYQIKYYEDGKCVETEYCFLSDPD